MAIESPTNKQTFCVVKEHLIDHFLLENYLLTYLLFDVGHAWLRQLYHMQAWYRNITSGEYLKTNGHGATYPRCLT